MTVETADQQQIADAAAEQAAANAAFTATRGVEPETKPEQAPEKSAADIEAENRANAEADAKASEVEWLNSVPQSVRERLERIPKLEATANQIGAYARRLKTAEDRIEEFNLAKEAAKAAAAAGGDAPTHAQITAASGNSEKWDRIKEDFPEWAEAMEERISGMRTGGVDLDGITKQVRESMGSSLTEVRDEARQLARIDMAHDGWEETVKTPAFKTWIEAQDEDTQALASSSKAKDAIKLLNAFKESNKSPEPEPEQEAPEKRDPKARLAAAVTPTNGNTAVHRETITEQEAADAAFKRVRGG